MSIGKLVVKKLLLCIDNIKKIWYTISVNRDNVNIDRFYIILYKFLYTLTLYLYTNILYSKSR